MRSTRLRSSRSALLPILLLVAAVIFWPTVDTLQRQSSSAQSVSWLGPDSTSYLTSSGIPVMVPSWLPGPVAGTSPEIYAGGGSYSIYFHGGGNSFLYITGVAGAGFPGGSEADLNVELTVNSSVQGYPAIQDIGIPAGSDVPIYDKVMWIANGVLYTVSGNGLDSDSVSLANSSVTLQPPAAAPAPTDPPVVEQPPVSNGSSGQNTSGSSSQTSQAGTSSGSTSGSSQAASQPLNESGGNSQPETGPVNEGEAEPTQSAAETGDGDGTSGPWYTGHGVSDVPSDGTAGPIPPRIGADDGTGGAP